jgi:AcrR family transcriptional regulator
MSKGQPVRRATEITRPFPSTKPAARKKTGKGRPRQIRAATIRNAILATARSLYAAGGYAAVTMRAIADELGLAAPSLYHHFASKDEIFLALQQKAVEMLLTTELQTSAVDPVEDLRLFFWRYYEFSKVDPDSFAILYADRSAPAFDAGIYKSEAVKGLQVQVETRIHRCIAAQAFPASTDAPRVGSALWAAAHGAATLRFIHKGQATDFDRVAADCLDFVIAGVRASRHT